MKNLSKFFGLISNRIGSREVKFETKPENEAIKDEVVESLKKRWEDLETDFGETYEEKFARMVDEAVLVIKSSWDSSVSYGDQYRLRASDIEVLAYEAFCISDELIVFSKSLACRLNPATGRKCFSENFKLNSIEEKERFLAEVMSRLPAGTELKRKDVCQGEGYDFILYISIE